MEWINVKDSLPKLETDTLLVVVEVAHSGKIFSDTDGFSDDDFDYWGDELNGGKVMYWSYLPPPPPQDA